MRTGELRLGKRHCNRKCLFHASLQKREADAGRLEAVLARKSSIRCCTDSATAISQLQAEF